MNLIQMIDRAKYRARDLGNLLTSKEVWVDHLNFAYYEFLEAAPFPFEIAQKSISFPAGTASESLPDGVFQVLTVADETDTTPLRPLLSWRAVMDVYPNISERGSVRHFRVIGSKLRLFPIPDHAVTVLVTYNDQPERLEEDADTPVLPERYHDAIVAGALVRVATDDRDADGVAIYRRELDSYVALAISEFSSPTGGRFVPLPRSQAPRVLH